MPGLYGITSNANISVSNTTGLYITSGNVQFTGNIPTSNTTGLYIGQGQVPILNNAQLLLQILSNNSTVGFSLTNANSQVQGTVLASGVTAGTYGDATDIPRITVGSDGRVTSITNVAVTIPATYGNANVAAYLPTYTGSLDNSSSIINLYANAAVQAGQIQTISANLGSFETYANATYATQTNLSNYEIYANAAIASTNANVAAANIAISNLQSNAAVQEGEITSLRANITAANAAIQTISANLGSFETYANVTYSTIANAASQQAQIDSTNANVTAANAAIQTINANIGSFYTYANVTYSTIANAASQQAQIDSTNANVTAANVAIQTISANLGAFETYANVTFVTTANSNTYSNSNVASYLSSGTVNTISTTGNITTTANVVATGNLSANNATITNKLTTTSLLVTGNETDSGTITAGNVISTGGYFWANGTAYSTSSGGGGSFSGDLAGNVIYDSVNGRWFGNAYPLSAPNLLSTLGSAGNIMVGTVNPVYTAGVVQPAASINSSAAAGVATTAAITSNLKLATASGAGAARSTAGTTLYTEVTPGSITMNNNDRIRGSALALDVNLANSTWGTMGTASQGLSTVAASSAFAVATGSGSIGPMVGMVGVALTNAVSGSANVQYATGVMGQAGHQSITANNPLASTITYARSFNAVVTSAAQANLVIVNAVGMHVSNTWSGSGSITNKYSILVDDINSPINTSSNLVINTSYTSGAPRGIIFGDGTFQNTAAGASSYGNTNVAAYLPTYTGNISAGNILTNNYLFANGVNILSTVSGSYGNTNVAAYLPTYTGNIGSAGSYSNQIFAQVGNFNYFNINPNNQFYANILNGGNLTIYSNAAIGNTLTTNRLLATGNATLSQNLSVGSRIDASNGYFNYLQSYGAIVAQDAQTLGNLTVGGTSTLSGNVVMYNNLSINGVTKMFALEQYTVPTSYFKTGNLYTNGFSMTNFQFTDAATGYVNGQPGAGAGLMFLGNINYFNAQQVNLTSDLIIDISNGAPSNAATAGQNPAMIYSFVFNQDGTGGRTVTYRGGYNNPTIPISGGLFAEPYSTTFCYIYQGTAGVPGTSFVEVSVDYQTPTLWGGNTDARGYTLSNVGNITVATASFNSTGSYTVAALTAITGIPGQYISVSDGTGMASGSLAFWDATNSQWSWVMTGLIVT